METILIGGFIVALGIVYFIPTIIAESKKHKQRGAIGALNLLLGWTMIGWIGALIWALTE